MIWILDVGYSLPCRTKGRLLLLYNWKIEIFIRERESVYKKLTYILFDVRWKISIFAENFRIV